MCLVIGPIFILLLVLFSINFFGISMYTVYLTININNALPDYWYDVKIVASGDLLKTWFFSLSQGMASGIRED